MGYREALEGAGANVIAFEIFGSYQGDWWALVDYKGTTGWVHGCYGSCSYCDAFESEFNDWDCEDKPDYQERLANFGMRYLDELYTQVEAENIAIANIDWDMSAKDILDFIKFNAIYLN